VTDRRSRIAVDGGHAHGFVNPQGHVFQIGCFAAAPGCLPVGATSDYWTWFPGYAWQVVVCRSCTQHLGWRFRGGAGGDFYGLILARLVETKE
jgi:hypothetical protein